MYRILRSEFDSGIYEHKWLKQIQSILQETGRNDVWLSHHIENAAVIKKNIYRTLLDQNNQIWQATVDSSSKGHNYKIFKSEIGLEKYLIELPKTVYLPLVKFRTTNHKLFIETGRWRNVPISDRKCKKCNNNSLGDEFHYLFECSFFKSDRELLLRKYFYNRPNTIKYRLLMNSNNKIILKNLSLFVQKIMKHFENDYKNTNT